MIKPAVLALSLLAVVPLGACGRSIGVGPTLLSVSPDSASNDRAVEIGIGAEGLTAADLLPRVFLDDTELTGVTARGPHAVAATVPAALNPATRPLHVVMADGALCPGELTFTVLAPAAGVR